MSKNNPLYIKADFLAKQVYYVSQNFPKSEMYGLTSQLRRAAISVILNIVEGFARQSKNEYRRFLLISFGSLEETRYILEFAFGQKYVSQQEFTTLNGVANEVAKIIWTIVNTKNSD